MAKKGSFFTCQHCAAQFYRRQSYLKTHPVVRFCSAACRTAAITAGTYKPGPADGPRPYRRLGSMLTCLVCSKEYYRKASEIANGVDKTCSVDCRHKWLSGENNHFSLNLDIPPRPKQWTIKQRKEWLASECVRCGSTDKLELDHIIPRGPHTLENSQTLCRTCNQRKYWFEDRLYYLQNPKGA